MRQTTTSSPTFSLLSLLLLAAASGLGCSAGPAGDPGETLGEQSQALPFTPVPTGLLPPISLSFTRATGTIMCRVPDGATTVLRPLADVPVEIAGRRVTTNASGAFDITGATFGLINNVRLIYEGPIASDGVSTRLQIMDDVKNTRTETRSVTGSAAGSGTVALGNVEVPSLDCELFRIGRLALRDFHSVRRASPPANALRVQRWSDIRVATHTFYDYINISPDWFDSAESIWEREDTFFHEFGHSIRHVADGPSDHWNWDNFRWAYARSHSGNEIFNMQYAFNEGWAGYWARARPGAPSTPDGPYGSPHAPGFLHWNENQIADRLFTLSRLPGSSDALMVDILVTNPGSIHTLFEFESRLNARLGLPAPPTPPQCPPTFTDDGATCRQGGAVVAKPSYGRGVGTIPPSCGAGNEKDGALCYPNCAPGYDGVGPVCWQICPAGYQDDGAFCRRDVQIINSTNHCPWWDACGLATERGCSTCPAGWQFDGCTCRIDAHIFAKSSYGRGVGWAPNLCSGSQQLDGGLCYTPCASGYNGVGPVCWGSCPATYTIDDGALCRQPLNILTKY